MEIIVLIIMLIVSFGIGYVFGGYVLQKQIERELNEMLEDIKKRIKVE